MKIKMLIIILLLATPLVLYAQQDSMLIFLENHLSDVTLTRKGRDLMAEKIIDGNLNQCKEIEDFLVKEAAAIQYETLIWRERVELVFLMRNFSGILDSAFLCKYETLRYFAHDDYAELLRKKFISEYSHIQNAISKSDLNMKESDFLSLLLKGIMESEQKYPAYIGLSYSESLREQVDVFKRKYSENDAYYRFIELFFSPAPPNKFAKTKRVRNLEAWNFSFALLAKFQIYEKEMSKKYSPSFTWSGNFDCSFHDVVLIAGLGNGYNLLLKTDVAVDSLDDIKINVFEIDLKLGYNIINNRIVRITPNAGVSWLGFKPRKKWLNLYPDLKQEKIPLTFAPVVGINLDFKFANLYSYQLLDNKDKDFFAYIRIGYDYYFANYKEDVLKFKGGIHQITLQLGFSYNGISH